ncbi:hypothetical protein ACFL6U_24535 [Planctomycetota bacterium]
MGIVAIQALRQAVVLEVFDYQTLLVVLSGYARPRDKITAMLRRGEIVRIKKGLYIFGKDYQKRPYAREVLANLIYGPSYVSMEYALSYYGLIPERVETVTSVAQGRTRRFDTPVGLFTYQSIPLAGYQGHFQRIELEGDGGFLMALPEKALAEKLRSERGAGLSTQHEVEIFVLENLRVDPSALATMHLDRLSIIGRQYRSRRIQLLSQWLQRFQKRQGGAHA